MRRTVALQERISKDLSVVQGKGDYGGLIGQDIVGGCTGTFGLKCEGVL
jgi:hypothetical protein